MKRKITKFLAAFALLVFTMPSLVAWGQTTVTYTQSSTSAVGVTSGTAPTGSSASFSTTYSNMNQLTAGNSMTLTLSGYQGKKITGITLSMKSNSSKGAGTLSVTAGSTTLASISPAANFNSSSWYGAWSTSYVDVVVAMSNNNYTIQANENVVVTIAATVNSLYCQSFTFTYEDGTGPALDPCDLALTDAPVELEFDLYNNNTAQVIHYTTSSTGEVSVAQNDYITATVNQQNKTITVTPIAVTNGAKTIRVNQAPDEDYASGYVEFTVDIEDSTPFTGGDVTFLAGTDVGSTTGNNSPDEMSKEVVTISSTDAAFATAEYRLYKSSNTTISTSTGTITQIVFTKTGSYNLSDLSTEVGSYNSETGTWTGNAESIDFAAAAQVRLSKIVVTVNLNATPDPIITADDVNLAYNATGGEISYVIENAVEGATLEAVVAEGASISNFELGTVGASPITFTCDANNSITDKTATVTLNYVKNGETLATKDVTVTQAANPNVALTTMDEIFARATEVGNTATDVTITLNNWVVSGANDSSHAFVTDGTKGFMIYATSSKSNHGFNAGDILNGTVQCKVQLYNGSAEITNLTSASDGLSVTTGGSVTIANIGLADLAGINTGALVSYENLTCSVTTSGNYTNYYLTDGTTQIQVYHTLYSGLASSLEDGKTYNITGVFVKNNNTKRVLPRSAEDIVEVAITEPNTITAGNLSHVSINELWDGDTFDPIELGDEVTEGTIVYFSLTVEENYTLESVTVLDADNEEVELTEASESWYFTMPNSSVTINATATQGSVPPVTGDKYVKVTATSDLTNGQYLIVYENSALAFNGSLETLDIAGNTIAVTISDSEIAVTEATTASEFTINTTNGTIQSASGYYIGRTSDANGMETSETEAYTNAISIDEDGNAVVLASGGAYLRYNATSGQERFRYFKSSSYTNQKAIQLYKKVEATPAGYTYTVTGYGNSDGGYVLMATPTAASVDPATVGMITDQLGANVTPETSTYDLYSYDQAQDKEWRNYRVAQNFELEPGKGYLYASKDGVTLTFTGDLNPAFDDVALPYTEGNAIKSLYLAGNSSTEAQTFYVYDNDNDLELQTVNFLTMNGTGDGFTTTVATSLTAQPMQGFFVQSAGSNWLLSTEDLSDGTNNNQGVSLLNINVMRDRGNVIDNAIVSFSEGSMMNKFYLRDNTTRVYIPQGNEEMAVVRSAAEAEMPVSFKASENGTYTLAIETENVEMNYLHLIDNLTGMDVDLLQTPSYTFEAKTNDYTSRFRLVFKASSTSSEADETFAYYDGSNWTVSNLGEATLQVVDVTGRTVSSETINGNATISLNQTPGVYMLRLVNGNSVRTQKIVVR